MEEYSLKAGRLTTRGTRTETLVYSILPASLSRLIVALISVMDIPKSIRYFGTRRVLITENQTVLEKKELAIRSLGYTSLGLAIGYAGNLVGVNWLALVTGIGVCLAVLVVNNLIQFIRKKKTSWEDTFNLLILLCGVLPMVARDAVLSATWALVFLFLGVVCLFGYPTLSRASKAK